jgi:hypothetical protein
MNSARKWAGMIPARAAQVKNLRNAMAFNFKLIK